MSETRLGRVQLQIMHVLWEKGQATAREITEILNEKERVAHSTVQTLLRKLEKKGAVTHHVDDRTFVYQSLVPAERVRKKNTHDLVERLFGGSMAGLVSYLIQNERIPPKELREIRRLIDASVSDTRGSKKRKRK